MSKPTNDQKLEAAIAEFTILLPRLTDQYRGSVKTCIQYLKDVQADAAKDTIELEGHYVLVTVGDKDEADRVIELLGHAEETGELDFAFGVKRS